MTCLKRVSLFPFIVWGLFLCSTAFAQNLVPNPSFEELYQLPGCYTVANKAEFESIMKYWVLPTKSTSDVFSTQIIDTCITSQPNSTATSVWVPTGKQMPRTGNTFAAMYQYMYYREYLEVKLTAPLIVGQKYCCEMYISLAEGSNIAQNDMAMYFSDTLVNIPNYNSLTFAPQIIDHDIIEDTINWIKVSGSFEAKSSGQYLIIGNFAANGVIDYDQVNQTDYNFPYYYIDDVSVEQIVPPPLTVTGNTTICHGDSLHLTASGWSDIQWSALDKPNVILAHGEHLNARPLSDISYLISGTVCEARFYDTIAVDFFVSPVVTLAPDSMICSVNSIILDAGSGFAHYKWQELATGQVISSVETVSVSDENKYAVTVTSNDGCWGGDTIQLFHFKNPSVNLGPDIYTCNAAGTLNATGNAYDRYSWQDSSTLSTFNYPAAGFYWVTVENPCGVKVSDSITVTALSLFVPNLITPDGNQLNDQFKIVGGLQGAGTLSVYNRYGARVYHNTAYNNEWDGSGLSDGVYYYTFSHPTCSDKSGWVEIVSSTLSPH